MAVADILENFIAATPRQANLAFRC